MKKFAMILTLAVLLAAILVGCGHQDAPTAPTTETTATAPTTATDPSSTETEPAPTEPEFDLEAAMEELPLLPENDTELVEFYREEVSSRLTASTEEFYSEEEVKMYQEWGFRVATQEKTLYDNGRPYHFAVPYRFSKDAYGIIYVDQGYVRAELCSGQWSPRDIREDAHEVGASPEGAEVISRSYQCKLVYTPATGEIQEWRLGSLVEKYQIPAGSVYAGKSGEGYIFRYESDVYALRGRLTGYLYEMGAGEVVPIAHGVKMVVDVNYDYGSDPWAQPLFLMEDGSLKVYLSWGEEELGAPDHPGNLYDVRYEGGYYKGD